MAGRTNDRELLALARTNKTPALQANDEGPKLFEDTTDKHACWSSCKLWEHRPRVPDLVNSSPPLPTHLTGLLIPLKKLFYSHYSLILVSIQCNEGLENKLTRAPLLGLVKYIYI